MMNDRQQTESGRKVNWDHKKALKASMVTKAKETQGHTGSTPVVPPRSFDTVLCVKMRRECRETGLGRALCESGDLKNCICYAVGL